MVVDLHVRHLKKKEDSENDYDLRVQASKMRRSAVDSVAYKLGLEFEFDVS